MTHFTSKWAEMAYAEGHRSRMPEGPIRTVDAAGRPIFRKRMIHLEEVLPFVRQGLTSKQIAAALEVSKGQFEYWLKVNQLMMVTLRRMAGEAQS